MKACRYLATGTVLALLASHNHPTAMANEAPLIPQSADQCTASVAPLWAESATLIEQQKACTRGVAGDDARFVRFRCPTYTSYAHPKCAPIAQQICETQARARSVSNRCYARLEAARRIQHIDREIFRLDRAAQRLTGRSGLEQLLNTRGNRVPELGQAFKLAGLIGEIAPVLETVEDASEKADLEEAVGELQTIHADEDLQANLQEIRDVTRALLDEARGMQRLELIDIGVGELLLADRRLEFLEANRAVFDNMDRLIGFYEQRIADLEHDARDYEHRSHFLTRAEKVWLDAAPLLGYVETLGMGGSAAAARHFQISRQIGDIAGELSSTRKAALDLSRRYRQNLETARANLSFLRSL